MAKKYVVINGYCSTHKHPLSFQCEVRDDGYVVVGSFINAGGGSSKSEEFTGKFYIGGTYKCRHCGNTCIFRCSNCGAISCVADDATSVVCPSCNETRRLRATQEAPTWTTKKDGQ